MSQLERYGTRDLLTYSRWHRADSLKRFIGEHKARDASLINGDWYEYCEYCREPVALIEDAQDVGQPHKSSAITTILAQRAKVPCYVVLWRKDEHSGDIVSFRVQQTHPWKYEPLRTVTPAEWAVTIANIHFRDHHCERQPAEVLTPTTVPQSPTHRSVAYFCPDCSMSGDGPLEAHMCRSAGWAGPA